MQMQIGEDAGTQVIHQVDGVTCWVEAQVSQVNKKQTLVARPSTEAKYGSSLAARDLIWLQRLLEEIDEIQNGPIPLICENQSCISCVKIQPIIQRPNTLSFVIISLQRVHEGQINV